MKENVDFIALSFVRDASDIDDLKKVLKTQSKKVKIISKIEDREGLSNIEDICMVSDAVMVARAAQGNPWFFERAKAHLNGTTPPPYPSLKEIAKICNRHFDLLLQSRGESAGTNLMRKHFSNYIKGFPGASEFRKKLITAPNLKAMKNALNQFKLSSY